MALPVRWRQYLQIEHRHWPMVHVSVDSSVLRWHRTRTDWISGPGRNRKSTAMRWVISVASSVWVLLQRCFGCWNNWRKNYVASGWRAFFCNLIVQNQVNWAPPGYFGYMAAIAYRTRLHPHLSCSKLQCWRDSRWEANYPWHHMVKLQEYRCIHSGHPGGSSTCHALVADSALHGEIWETAVLPILVSSTHPCPFWQSQKCGISWYLCVSWRLQNFLMSRANTVDFLESSGWMKHENLLKHIYPGGPGRRDWTRHGSIGCAASIVFLIQAMV